MRNAATTHEQSQLGSRVVGLVVGGLLLVAAGLKVYGLSVSAVPPVGWLASPSVQTLAVLWELGLGVWLLTGLFCVPAWLTVLFTFTGFALISGWLGLQGVASCGCFGVISASPWYAFGLDVFALELLALFRPTWNRAEVVQFARPALLVSLTAFVLVGSFIGVGSALYGSPGAALAKLRGDAMNAPGYLDFGPSMPGQPVEATASITNYTDQPIRLIGGTSDCSCVTTAEMPLTIPPGGTVGFLVKLKVPASATPGRLTRTAEIWTDCDRHRIIRFRLGAMVNETAATPP